MLFRSSLKEDGPNTAINYGFLMESADIGYVPVYADIIYSKEENDQMKKLVRFSLFSFLEEYLNETGQGIVFKKDDKIAIVLKGNRQEDMTPKVEEIWARSLKAAGHTPFFCHGGYGLLHGRDTGHVPKLSCKRRLSVLCG